MQPFVMNKDEGFTLIELLLVLAIIGIISAIAIPALLGQRESARNRATQSNASNIAGVLQNSLDIVEQPPGERTAVDLAAATTITETLDAVKARPEYLQMNNPFDTSQRAYTFGAAAVAAGEVGLNPVNPGGIYVIEISFGLRTQGATAIQILPKSPETTLPL